VGNEIAVISDVEVNAGLTYERVFGKNSRVPRILFYFPSSTLKIPPSTMRVVVKALEDHGLCGPEFWTYNPS
jgi:hypothetical protein